MSIEQWNFMMDFCRMRGWNPGDPYFWNLAELEYCKQLKGNHE